MKISNLSTPSPASAWRRFLQILLLLLLLLGMLFGGGIIPGHVVFSNDGPLGAISAASMRPPGALLGVWSDLNWVGSNGGALALGPSAMLSWICGPGIFAKLYPEFALLFAGLGAWFFCRQMKFSPIACLLAGIAAALNSDFFNTACWGVAGHPICFGCNFLALGALADTTGPKRWSKVMLAGLAVGLGVIEAADIGALFSMVVAAYVVAQGLAGEGGIPARVASGFSRLALVAGCAAFIAAASLSALIGVQIKGVVGMGQDAETKAQRWSEATQNSIPKAEAFGILVPGLFGLRFDTPDGGAYWGTAGSDLAWDDYLNSDRKGPPPGGTLRAGAGSSYAGALVILGALWAVFQSFLGTRSFFTAAQRKLIWFWLIVVFFSLLLLFGRFAPFYQFFYALPYASTIRNPAKFLHVLEWSLIILFGYGMHGLATRNLEKAGANPRALFQHVSGWWKTVGRFDREWVIGSWLGLLAFAGAWGIYAASRGRVENYVAELSRLLTLQSRGHPDPVALAQAAHETVGFSLSQVGWAVLFFSLGVGGLILITSGYFAGKRAVIAGGFLCALMAVDLGWQDREWVRTWNWKEKYVETTDNPVFDFLRQKPYEHRVASLPRWVTALYRLDPQLVAAQSEFQQVYDIEWTQHLFLFHDIQSLDIIQMPRRPVEVEAFEQTFHFDYTTNAQFLATRRWQLTNTRYLLGTAPLVQLLNQAFDPVQQRFRALMLFEIYQNAPGGPILTRTNDVGPYALMEFSGALPRAKLYTHWETVPYDAATVNSWLAEKRSKLPPFMTSAFSQISTNDLAALQRLADRNFDPDQTVLLSEPLATALSTNATPGTVQFVSYSPKHLRLKSNASSPTVLLLNDKYDPGWRVTVDGAPAQLLRCNYVMRGVYLPTPGEHTIEFVFERPRMPLYVSVAGVAFGILLLVFVNVKR